jgi:hypothetical protein
MSNERKQKLIDLGAEALADALLNLAVHSDEADELIEQLIASPEENVQRFKMKLGNLRNSDVLSIGEVLEIFPESSKCCNRI